MMAKKDKKRKKDGTKGNHGDQRSGDAPKKMKRKDYERELAKLEVELVKLQGWIQAKGLKVAVLFEGRDSAGKGGVIRRITYRLNPRVARHIATPTPTARQKSEWFFQRYVPHLPAAGEMCLFDRSWYNRAGVERVMGFCTEDQLAEFYATVNPFELAQIRSGTILIKYWLEITDETQEERFEARLHDPRKRWKLSPMDLKARSRWVDYSKARDAMLAQTSTVQAPWYLVDANVKSHARLNLITHLLSMIPYEDLTPDPMELPLREKAGDYVRPDLSGYNWVPKVF